MLPAAATGAKVGEPQPLVENVSGLATFIAPGVVGNVSEKATPLIWSFWLGLVIENVSVDVPPATIGFAQKFLLICGGARTVNVAVEEPVVVMFVPVPVVWRY